MSREEKREGGQFIQQANIIQNIYLYENAKDSILNAIKQNLGPFAHSKLCFLDPSLWPVFFPFQFQPVSHLLTFSLLLPLLQQSVADFHLFFFPPSAYKPENLPPALPRCWKWRECGKGVITMSIHKHRRLRDGMDERTNATGKLPTQAGQVICYTVEQNKHSDNSIYSQSKMDTPVPT